MLGGMQDVPVPTSDRVSARMSRHPRRDTKPELAVRRLAHRAGLRYRVDVRPIEGLNRRADMVFSGPRVAVFVDGCFWHGCPEHCRLSGRNVAWWERKIHMNRLRDHETDDILSAEGWSVLRTWAHQDPKQTVESLIALVRARSGG